MIGRLIDAAAFVVLMPPRVARAPHTDEKADESTCLGESGLPKQQRDKCPKRAGVAEVAPIRPFWCAVERKYIKNSDSK
jgi:hypothetical protein